MRILPELIACPQCGFRIQQGENEDGLAFHDCLQVEAKKEPPMSPEQSVRTRVMHRLLEEESMGSGESVDLLMRLMLLRAFEGSPALHEYAKTLSALAEYAAVDQDDGGGLLEAFRQLADVANDN